MDDGVGQDIATAVQAVAVELVKSNKLQEEANGLMRSFVPALEATAQELLELRQQLAKSEEG